MDKSHLFSRTARKPRSERNCSGFFLCRGIIKRCTPLGSKCTPHRPFVKWYRGVKRKRLHGDNFRITVEPVIVKKYMKTLANRSFYKKKLDTNQDTHCIKIGVQLWCARRDLNPYVVDTRTSNVPVCQFQHSRITNAGYYSTQRCKCQDRFFLGPKNYRKRPRKNRKMRLPSTVSGRRWAKAMRSGCHCTP